MCCLTWTLNLLSGPLIVSHCVGWRSIHLQGAASGSTTSSTMQHTLPLHPLPAYTVCYILHQHTLSATSSSSIHCLLHPLTTYTSAKTSTKILYTFATSSTSIRFCYILYQHTLPQHPLLTYTSATFSTSTQFRYILYHHTLPLHPLPAYTSATSSTDIHFLYILYQHTLLLRPLPPYTSATSSTNIHFCYPLPTYPSSPSSTNLHFCYIL